MNASAQAIRRGIKETATVLDVTQAMPDRPAPFTYVPRSHARALDPDATIVEGIRGAGKSFWFAALASATHLSFVRDNFPETRLPATVKVAQGFGAGLSIDHAPDQETLADLLGAGLRPRSIWRAVVARHAGIGGSFATLATWIDRVRWVQENAEQFARDIETADRRLVETGSTLLILFDALDRMADDWQHVHQHAKALLQVALDIRSLRAIRCKIFVRPDLLQDANVTSFADYSKLLATKASLAWQRSDLYALLYQGLGNADFSKGHFAALIQDEGASPAGGMASRWSVPTSLRTDEDRQEKVFERIAGRAMGSSIKRGKPYTWLVNHLQDGLNQVSPRSFLAALNKAADETTDDFPLPLDYRGIQRGVQAASQIRVQEISEDYPWVRTVMDPLRNELTVPCTDGAIETIWKIRRTIEDLNVLIAKSGNTAKLPPQHLEQGHAGLIMDLQSLGMVQRIAGGRIQMPDVFRVAFGLGRRGGVKPVK